MKKITVFALIFFVSVLHSQKKKYNDNDYMHAIIDSVYSELNQKINNISNNTIFNNLKFDKKIDSILKLHMVTLINFEEKNNEIQNSINSINEESKSRYNEIKNLIDTNKTGIFSEIFSQEKLIENLFEENLKLKDSLNQTNKDISINKLNLKNASSEILNVKKDIVESENYALIGFVFFLLLVFVIYILISRKWSFETSELNRKQQEIIEKQIEDSRNLADWLANDSQNQITSAKQNDHSFAKRVADEIVRMSTNLSRMDESIRGYKQLSASVRKLTQTLSINQYEIVELLNKPYSTGMNLEANFVFNDKIEKGKQIITRIIKPQINYKGKMIQGAQVEVSQND